MARPRKSTRDEWIDVFADWSADQQEAALDLAECVHRQTKRSESRRKPQPAADAAETQPSLSLPDRFKDNDHFEANQ